MHLRVLTVTAVVLAGALGVARADVWRWVDPQGITHYSDEWVPGSVLVKTVKQHPGSASRSSSSLTTTSNRISAQLTEDSNARAMRDDMAKAHDAMCSAAKDRYFKAIESRRVYKEDANGERQYLSDADADSYREQARKDVQDRCGSVPEWKPNQPIPEPQPINPQPIPEPQVKPVPATPPSQ